MTKEKTGDPVRTPAADTLLLDSKEVRRRREFLELGDKDVSLLKGLHTLLAGRTAAVVESLCAHLRAFEELGDLLQGEATIAHLKQTQAAYFDTLTGGDYGAAYIRDRLRVGAVHQRIGLEPKWYLGAYNKYLALLLPEIWALSGGDGQKALETTRALLKVVFLDMGIAIDSYIHANSQAIGNKAEQLAVLNQVAIAISSTFGSREVLERIMRSGIALTGSKAACIAFYGRESRRFEKWYTQGLSDHFVKNMAFRSGGLADEAFTSGTYVLSNDGPDTRHKLSALAREEGVVSFICLPLISRAHPLGVLYFYRQDRDSFLPEELSLLTTFAHLAAGAIENSRLYATMADLASTDSLTGVLNRRVFTERLENEMRRSRRYGRPFSLMMIDIDHFKTINDTHGHSAGDAVLKTLAALLLKQTRDVDSLARYGGEEFMVILPESEGGGSAGERILKAVADAAFTLPDGSDIRITVSIGIASFPRSAESTKALIECVDRALYSAKRDGRNRVCVYPSS